jgi:hypothetical protein
VNSWIVCIGVKHSLRGAILQSVGTCSLIELVSSIDQATSSSVCFASSLDVSSKNVSSEAKVAVLGTLHVAPPSGVKSCSPQCTTSIVGVVDVRTPPWSSRVAIMIFLIVTLFLRTTGARSKLWIQDVEHVA